MSNETTPAQLRSLRALFAAALLLCGVARADDLPDVERVARSLVDEALAANLGLDQAESNVDQRLAILDQARAEYLPQIDLQLRYSEANGGRTIEVPALGLDFRFLREREQDSYVRLTQPIYDPRLAAAETRRGICRGMPRATGSTLTACASHATCARPTTAGSPRASPSACSRRPPGSRKRTSASTTACTATARSRGTCASRAEAEHLEITQQILRARAAEDLARRYLNLLCNAPLEREPEAPVVTDADLPRMAHGMPAARGVALEERAVDRRAELRELDSGIAAAGEAESAARAAFKPQLAFAVDAGTQGEEWDYSVEDSYVLASVIVRFNLFNGGGDRAAIREARARSAGLTAGRQLAEQQIRIEVQQAITDLEVAEASLETAARRVEAADAAYAIVAKKRDLGQVSSAEYLDAQRALTQARLNGNVTRFQAFGALARGGIRDRRHGAAMKHRDVGFAFAARARARGLRQRRGTGGRAGRGAGARRARGRGAGHRVAARDRRARAGRRSAPRLQDRRRDPAESPSNRALP